MIPHEVIEEVKARNPIEDVISSYVTLKRAGSNMNGLCPFHSEKTPSFTVFLGSSSFYCFGCGAGGDAISFIMRAENLDYPGAIEFLAKRSGITIPQNVRGAGDDAAKKKARTLEMNRYAAKFFHKTLYSPAGAEGLKYLRETRKLSDAVIKHFGLGYAPNDFGILTKYLTDKGFSAKELKEGFLCGISEKTKRPYDYFRNRVIFPIIDVTGNVIAFGGRVMDDSKPKYLNTSDTPAFKKSRNLFALNFAKNHSAEQMILCEGYMDVIALHAVGIENAVATLGTAITPEQARMFSRYTKSVIISYDSDEAGQRAANKAFQLLSEVGVETKILKMEGAKDPDEYIKKFGVTKFKMLLSEGRGRFDYTFDNILAKYDINLTDDRLAVAREMTKVIAEIPSAVERDVYTHKVAEKLALPFETLKADIERESRKSRAGAKKEEMRQVVRKTEGYGDRVNPDYIKNVRAARAEEGILGILLSYTEFISKIKGKLSPDDFYTAFGKSVYEAIVATADESGLEFGMLNEFFDEGQMSRITQMRVAREGLKNDETVLEECIDTLKSSKENNNMDLNAILQAKRSKKQ